MRFSSQWIPNIFNRYYSTFAVTEDLLSAKTSAIYINGPAADVSILFDKVTFRQLQDRDCSKLVANGRVDSLKDDDDKGDPFPSLKHHRDDDNDRNVRFHMN